MRIRVLFFCVLCAIFSSAVIVCAQTDVTVEGIILGEEPLAIVNGEVVKEGDEIGGLKVKQIKVRSVVFEEDNGKTLTKYVTKEKDLAEEDAELKENIDAKKQDEKKDQDKYYKKAVELHKKSETYLQSDPSKAIELFGEAVKQAKWSLSYDRLTDEQRNEILSMIETYKEKLRMYEHKEEKADTRGWVVKYMDLGHDYLMRGFDYRKKSPRKATKAWETAIDYYESALKYAEDKETQQDIETKIVIITNYIEDLEGTEVRTKYIY